jgi:hypothetical protein
MTATRATTPMTSTLRILPLAVTTVALLLSACVAPPRTVDQDAQFKSVAVVSMLDESPRVMRIGVTVFGNVAVNINQDAALNKLATEVVEQRLKTSRPNWMIRKAMAEPADLLQKQRTRGGSWHGFLGNIKQDLREIAERSDADLLFVVFGHGTEEFYGGVGIVGGVGSLYRCRSDKSDGTARVYAHTLLILVDKSGSEIMQRSGGDQSTAFVALDLPCDVAQLQAPPVAERLLLAMQRQLFVSLVNAAIRMGY